MQIFSQNLKTFSDLSLYCLNNIFVRSKVLNADEVQGSIFPFMNHDFGVLLIKNFCLV